MDTLVAIFQTHAMAVVFLVTLAARLGAPVPAVPFVVAAGGMSMGEPLVFAGVMAAGVAGTLVGDTAWFYAGRRWGYGVMRLLCRISLSADTCVQRSEAIIGRWGGVSLLLAKFVPGVSLVAPPMAGALHMTTGRFLAYDIASAAVWALAFLVLGLAFHAMIADVLAAMAQWGLVATAIVVFALAGLLVWRYVQRRRELRAADIERMSVDALIDAMGAATMHAQAGAETDGEGASRSVAQSGPLVLDVRAAEARARDPDGIPGAVGADLGRLRQDAAAWRARASGNPIVLYCDCPQDASAVAGARALQRAEVPHVRVLEGGLDAWRAARMLAEFENRRVIDARSVDVQDDRQFSQADGIDAAVLHAALPR